MGNVFSLIRKIFGRNRGLSNDMIPTPEMLISKEVDETPVPMNIDLESLVNCIIEDGYTCAHFDMADLRILAGNKTLTVIYDRCELGLHSFGIYNYCTTSDYEGHKLMATTIRENEDNAYKSLLIESSKDELWLNIADCTNRGAGATDMYDPMLEVFEPVILRFIMDNVVNNNVGLSIYNGNGTSLSAHLLCQKLKELGLNIHIAMIESRQASTKISTFKYNYKSSHDQLMDLSCTYKVFQYHEVVNIFDFDRVEESRRNILLEAVSYLKSIISE